MNLDIIITLAFLSYYRYSFFLPDFLVFGLIAFSFYHLTYQLLPPMVPEKFRTKYEWFRKVLSGMLASQMFCYVVMIPFIFFQKPLMIHMKTTSGFLGFVLVILIILRLMNTLMLVGFLVCCWQLLDKKDRTYPITRWFVLMIVLVLYYLWTLFYMLFPSLNKALDIYEMFYNIRNLYITNDPKKKYKTFQYLQKIKCIPNSYYPLYMDEWKRTFHNRILPLEC